MSAEAYEVSHPLSAASEADVRTTLESCTTELAWMQALPRLVHDHGFEAVDAAAAKYLSPSQRKLCWKLVHERSKRIVWIDGDVSHNSITSFAIIVTTFSLDEIARKSWAVLSSPADILDFVVSHADDRLVLGGTQLEPLLLHLVQAMPQVHAAIGHASTIDTSSGGLSRYAALIGTSVLPGAQVADFEANEGRRCTPGSSESTHLAQEAARSGDLPCLLRAEHAITATGWARSNLLAPPKAAKYVTFGLYGYCAFLALLTLNLLATSLW